MLQNSPFNCSVNFIVGNSEQEGLGVPIISKKSWTQAEILWHLPPSPCINFASIWDIRCLGWAKDYLWSFTDHHRVLLLPESALFMASCWSSSPVWCQKGFLLCLWALGRVCQWWAALAVAVRQQWQPGDMGLPFLLRVLIFALLFLRLMLSALRGVNSK